MTERVGLIMYDEMTGITKRQIDWLNNRNVDKSEEQEEIVVLANGSQVYMSEIIRIAGNSNMSVPELIRQLNNMIRPKVSMMDQLAELAKSMNDVYLQIGPLSSHLDGHPGKTYFAKKNRRVGKYR